MNCIYFFGGIIWCGARTDNGTKLMKYIWIALRTLVSLCCTIIFINLDMLFIADACSADPIGFRWQYALLLIFPVLCWCSFERDRLKDSKWSERGYIIIAWIVYHVGRVLWWFGLFYFFYFGWVFINNYIFGVFLNAPGSLLFTIYAVFFFPTGILFMFVYYIIFHGIFIHLNWNLRQQRETFHLTETELRKNRKAAHRKIATFIVTWFIKPVIQVLDAIATTTFWYLLLRLAMVLCGCLPV